MVKIIGCSSTDEKICAAAGRISTQKGTSLEIFDRSQDQEKNANLISKVTASGHTSTVEHIFFNLAFDNVSVVLEQFMIEFRLASFTVKSRRYVDFSESGFFIPEINEPDLKEKFISHVQGLFELYGKLTENGVPKEDARFVLPYCFFSNFFCSLNGRELIFVLRAMLFGRGSKIKEIRQAGVEILEQAKEYAPGVFGDFERQYSEYNDTADLDFLKLNSLKAHGEAVEILSFTPDAEKVIAESELIARFGISSAEAEKIAEENKKEIISALSKTGRPRAFESACFTIRFNDVSLATLTHFSRHRMQTLVLPDLDDTDRMRFILPPSVVSAGLEDEYKNAFESTAKLFEEMKKAGEEKSETVYCLLAGNTLDIVSVMNARELQLFMKLRSCSRAQWEINALAVELLAKLRGLFPSLFAFFGPSCFVTGKCPEGRLACGKMKEVVERFSGELKY